MGFVPGQVFLDFTILQQFSEINISETKPELFRRNRLVK